MKLYLCTLFDSNYLDKGLVLHNSLERCCSDYILYILPMDDKCAEVLKDLKLSNVQVLNYNEFEDTDLKQLKQERTQAEFCWTCTAKLIKFVIRKYSVPMCTYVDADLCFYDSPDILIREMLDSGASVQVVRHNFRKFERKESEKSAGVFCVEFNTFVADKEGMEVLESWESDCVKECSYGKNKEVLGDQKYLEKWPKRYSCINICENQGAGVAPWNVNKFTYERKDDDHYEIIDTESKKRYPLVFFHFQNICFIDDCVIDCCVVNKKVKDMVSAIYTGYLRMLKEKKNLLYHEYGINSMIRIHPADASKPVIVFNPEKAKGIKWIRHILRSLYLISRSSILHFVYCRNEERLIIELV